MGRIKRIRIAKETMRITEQGFYYNQKGEKIMLETENGGTVYAVELYSPQTLQHLLEEEQSKDGWGQPGRTEACSFILADADSFAAAEGMEAPLVMNFANARHVGGGGRITTLLRKCSSNLNVVRKFLKNIQYFVEIYKILFYNKFRFGKENI